MPLSLCVFDAYGTLFDVTAPARDAANGYPALQAVWQGLAKDWRAKQLEYTWQRAITGPHADFAQVTADALDWAMDAQGLSPDAALRTELLARFDRLPLFPEVVATLERLAHQGMTCAILSNGTPQMLKTLVDDAAVAHQFKELMSVDAVQVYKPDARVYALVAQHFNTQPGQVLFVSANGWDISGAAGFGFRTAWINRNRLPPDRLPHAPRHIVTDLSDVCDLVRP